MKNIFVTATAKVKAASRAVTNKVKAVALAVTVTAGSLLAAPQESQAAVGTLTPPTMPDATSTYQKMVDSYGEGGTIALAIIGAAVALGIMVILAMYGWKLAKKWTASAK